MCFTDPTESFHEGIGYGKTVRCVQVSIILYNIVSTITKLRSKKISMTSTARSLMSNFRSPISYNR